MKKPGILLLVIFSLSFAQDYVPSIVKSQEFGQYNKKFFTDAKGNILMNINIWGHVNVPGIRTVSDGIDFITLLSLVGGPRVGANLKEIRIFREEADANGSISYTINMEEFLESGDRSSLITVKPNDTIVVPQKFSSIFMENVNLINLLFSAFNLYMQFLNLTNNN